jgi:hypothetical protein
LEEERLYLYLIAADRVSHSFREKTMRSLRVYNYRDTINSVHWCVQRIVIYITILWVRLPLFTRAWRQTKSRRKYATLQRRGLQRCSGAAAVETWNTAALHVYTAYVINVEYAATVGRLSTIGRSNMLCQGMSESQSIVEENVQTCNLPPFSSRSK